MKAVLILVGTELLNGGMVDTNSIYMAEQLNKYGNVKKIIQFNLNKKNRENYYSFLAEKNIEVEAEYFRNIFLHYAQKSKKSREFFIFKDIIGRIASAIDNKKR